MKEITRQVLLSLVFFAFILYSPLLEARNNVVTEDLKTGLSLAEAHLLAFRNDSVIAITDDLLKSLKARGQLDTPFAIRVLLAEGMALENDEQGDIALKKLLHVEQQSQKYLLGDIHVKACLALALLFEKNGLTENSRKYLDLAEADINRYGLDQDYAYFAIRRASWERLFGEKDSALLFTRRALKAASKRGLVLEKAISHMLLNMLLPGSSVDERMHHSLAAVKLYQQLEDQAGCSYMFVAVARLYSQQRKFLQALAYSDSALQAANRSIAAGHTRHALVGSTYRLRGSIFREIGLPDSALANMQKGFELDLKLKEENVKDKVLEVESRYQDKHKDQQLEENRLAIQLKNSQLRFSVVTVFLVLILTVSLFFGYRKQKRDKKKLLEQNRLIHNRTIKLEAPDAAKSRFFANAPHELPAPIDNLPDNQTARKLSVTHKEEPGSSVPFISEPDQEWLEMFERYVENNLANSALSVPELAHHFAMSESTLLRQLKRLTGLSPGQYVQAVRLEVARRLLENGTFRSITQVAAQVGYGDVRSFSRSFRIRFGKLPSQVSDVD